MLHTVILQLADRGDRDSDIVVHHAKCETTEDAIYEARAANNTNSNESRVVAVMLGFVESIWHQPKTFEPEPEPKKLHDVSATIEVDILVEHGTKIRDLREEIEQNVGYALEDMTDIRTCRDVSVRITKAGGMGA